MAYKKKNHYDQYTKISYGGTRTIQKHGLGKYGVWEIKGEDSNADFGGHHSQPALGVVEGTLDDAIRYAVELPRFWAWGGGGDIILREDINSAIIKVPIVDEGDEMTQFKNQILDSEDDDPSTLLPTAAQVQDRIKAKEAEQRSLTYGMIAAIKTALEEAEKFPITIEFTREEMANRAKTVVDVLEAQGFKSEVGSSRSDKFVSVKIDIRS